MRTNYTTTDLTGKQYGMLTVLRRDENDYIQPKTGKHVARWICRCQCGGLRSVPGNMLRSGHAWHCGCQSTNKLKDLTGQTFGKLTVIERADDYTDKNGEKHVCWKCKCLCGNECIVRGHSLRNGHTKSCGCAIVEAATKHGMHGTRIYNTYKNMLDRCYNKNNDHYMDYGGRGIKVCNAWRGENGFINFYNWAMANGYTDELSIDRINVNGNYEPNNCRWADSKMQANNKRNTIYIEYNGETHTISEWSTITGIPYATIYDRYVNKQWTAYQTLYTAINDQFIRIANSYGEIHTLQEWSSITGISSDLLYDRIIKKGWNIDRALTTLATQGIRYITYDGTTMTCADWDRARGFTQDTTCHRLNKGMSIEDALNTPIMDSKGNVKIPINAIYFVDDNGKPIKE